MRADQLVTGIELLPWEATRLGVDLYIKDYAQLPASMQQGFLVISNTGGGFGGAEENFSAFGIDSLGSIGTGRAYGMEISLQKKLSEIPLYGTVSLSFSKAEYAGADKVRHPGSYDRTFIGNLVGGYILSDSWEFSTSFRIATGTPFTPFDDAGGQDPALYNSARIKTAHALDLRVDKRWFFGGWNLTTYIDVQNVYNYIAESTPRYNAREGKLESLDELGIFPTIGVSAEF
jgi:hypothetical protein